MKKFGLMAALCATAMLGSTATLAATTAPPDTSPAVTDTAKYLGSDDATMMNLGSTIDDGSGGSAPAFATMTFGLDSTDSAYAPTGAGGPARSIT